MAENQSEEWRAVDGYEGFYEVSNRGRVRSIDRMVLGAQGKTQRLARGRVLSQSRHKYGYPMVMLKREGKQKLATVHRLVAIAFVPG